MTKNEDNMKSSDLFSLDKMTSVIQSLLIIIRKFSSSKKVQNEIKKTIKTLLSPDFWGEKHAVSKEAQKFVKENNEHIDRRKYPKTLASSSWNDLGNKYLKVKKEEKEKGNIKNHNGLRGLILEHIILRSDILDLLLECDPDNDYDKIKDIISHTKCAVIKWTEDDELTKNKKGSDRGDPIDAYKKIKLIFPDDYNDISHFIDSEWVNKNITNNSKLYSENGKRVKKKP
jgi:hypothetical protein